MRRRTVLLGGAGLLAAGAGTWAARRAGWLGPPGLDALRETVDRLPEGVVPLGAEVLARRSGWVDEGVLAGEVLDGWDGAPMAVWLLGRARADYVEPRTTLLAGWTFSRTEAGVFALAALRRTRAS